MKEALVASRYAKALVELATEAKKEEAWLNEIRQIKWMLFSTDKLAEQIDSPNFSPEDSEKMVEAAFSSKGISKEIENLLKLMAKRKRISLLSMVAEAYQAALDSKHNVIRGVAKSKGELSEPERTSLVGTIEKTTGKKVILEYAQDPTSLGGVVANVGSYSFDGSIETQLRLMKDELKRRAH